MKAFIYCTLVFYLSINASCKKRFNCKQTIYSFEGNFKAYPALDSIHVNDTIWLESIIPVNLKNLINNEIVDYRGAVNLGTAIGYIELIGGSFSNPGAIPAANSFENILIKGSASQTDKQDQIRAYRFIEEGEMYFFKLGIVAKRKGLFTIGPGNAANVYTRSNECDKAGFDLTFKDTDQHIYLLEKSRPGYTASGYEQTHAYTFKVY